MLPHVIASCQDFRALTNLRSSSACRLTSALVSSVDCMRLRSPATSISDHLRCCAALASGSETFQLTKECFEARAGHIEVLKRVVDVERNLGLVLLTERPYREIFLLLKTFTPINWTRCAFVTKAKQLIIISVSVGCATQRSAARIACKCAVEYRNSGVVHFIPELSVPYLILPCLPPYPLPPKVRVSYSWWYVV